MTISQPKATFADWLLALIAKKRAVRMPFKNVWPAFNMAEKIAIQMLSYSF